MFSLIILAAAAAQAPAQNQSAGPTQPPQAELVWIRTASAQACDEAALRQAVAMRLGYDPFVPTHSTKVLVEVSGTTTLTARVRVARQGTASAERTLSGPPDCRSLTEAMALALAVAVDPLVLTRIAPIPPPNPPAPAAVPAKNPPEAVAPATSPALSATASPPMPPPAEDPPAAPAPPIETHLAFWAAAALDLGHQPGGLLGARLGARLSLSRFSLGLAGWVGFPSSAPLSGGGTVDALGAGGNLDLCLHLWRLAGCVAGRAGALGYQGHQLTEARSGWVPTVQAGPRVAFEFPQDSLLAVHAAAELWLPVVRTRMLAGGSAAWEQPVVAGGVLVGLTLRAW